jgi:hypothetical protein
MWTTDRGSSAQCVSDILSGVRRKVRVLVRGVRGKDAGTTLLRLLAAGPGLCPFGESVHRGIPYFLFVVR